MIVAVRGPSGSGKTTLIERLLARLTARGLKVGIVKHAHHGLDLDRRGKDSWRFWEAGAQAVVTAGPNELFVRQRRSPSSLAELMQCLPQGLDCIVVEGFTRSAGAVDVEVAVHIELTARGVRLDGQRVARGDAAAAIEHAIVSRLGPERLVVEMDGADHGRL